MWKMNEQSIFELLQELSKADEVITTQILEMPWQSFFTESHQTLFRHLNTNSTTAASVTNEKVTNNDSNNSSTFPESREHSASVVAPSSTENSTVALNSTKYSSEQVSDVLKLLVQETPFLIPEKLNDTISNMAPEKKLLYSGDAILKALGIEDVDDLEELLSLFINKDKKVSIGAQQVIPLIKSYITSREQNKTSKFDANLHKAGHNKSGNAFKEKDMRRCRKDAQFWTNLMQIFPEQTKNVWTTLETYMRQLNQILEQRQQEAQQVQAISEENNELKKLLQQHLNSDLNRSLLIPPSALLNF
ncbi:hypothetical protein RFI_10121 [Reticulomyxa filosa]|uniref:Dynein regulatory complex protein 1 C-terminal domain-containing protein n=1 Tax=Reticulomyxa filosa TaxID=46433 RepID=X6NM70_RETFI|nr:hypothetical protein RFI_10121 [Reticulomyxa filosa]|eukprot:ETO27013.1 hypothetical protein RFI_10121 [Reticulomyxa filosa]